MEPTGKYDRYLSLLDIRSRPGGLDGLKKLVYGHLTRIPFENVSKLLLFEREGIGRPLSLDEFLDGIEFFDLGGTCHSCNPFLAGLLKSLDYEADLLGADMDEPDVHTCVRVRLNGAEYHVDQGYAAPFRSPINLDRLPYEIAEGELRYIVDRRIDDGRIEVSIKKGDERIHGYVVNETPRNANFFNRTILESFEPGRQFMTNLRIKKFFEQHTVELRNNTMTRIAGTGTKLRKLTSLEQLQAALIKEFNMPRCPVKKAIEILERNTGRPFFVLDD